MIDVKAEAEKLVDLDSGLGLTLSQAESYLKDLSSRIREEAIDELIGRFQAKAKP